ncbi:MAG TPA: mechanosensitive ion channel [Phycisphaerae bacterium]|nr:mechanosensitive ion channel [Phycisphaerales bacterium]HRX85622.1 mechanosensitive ion channel [Phycisphaerae bacterium]
MAPTLLFSGLLVIGVAKPAGAQPELPGAPTPMASADGQPGVAQPDGGKSIAERIVDLKSSIQASEDQLTELHSQLDDPQSERAQAEAEFTALDQHLKEKQQAVQAARDEGAAAQAKALQEEIDPLQKRWKLARERFDLALKEETALRTQIQTLETRVAQDRQTLQRLQAPSPTPAATADGAANDASQEESTAQSKPKAKGPSVPTGPPGLSALTSGSGPNANSSALAKGGAAGNAEAAQARKAAEQKQAAAQRAEADVQSLSARITTLKAQIDSEKKLQETAEEKVRLAREQRDALQEQIDASGTPQNTADLRAQLADAKARAADAQTDVRARKAAIADLQGDLADLQAEQSTARQHAESKRAEANAATQEVDRLENPFNPHNIVQWLLDHGPKIAGIILGAFVLLWITKAFEHKLVRFLVGRKDHGSPAERENRANTLASVFRNVAFLVVIVGSILMILTELSVQIGPLLGGVAVVGLAVAFGAQSLVKDYFSGFIILMENQYTVNDVVKIGDTAGLVERITLRMTVLRDLEGVAHFIPHGEATKVSNLTHGWSRAVLDIGVSYNEDAEHVMKVLTEIGQDLYADEQYQPLMLSEPEILGLDALGDSAIVIKLMVKTRPLQQWTIKRQFLLRIKRRFDEVGIEIPYPHRTLYHRWEEDQRLTVVRDDAEAVAGTSRSHDGDARR